MNCIFNEICTQTGEKTCCFECNLLGWCRKHEYQICRKYECPYHEIYDDMKHYPINDFENWFIEGIGKLKNPNNSFDILNWYRNLYYQNDKNTERGKMAWAINDVLNKLKELGVDLRCLSDENKK